MRFGLLRVARAGLVWTAAAAATAVARADDLDPPFHDVQDYADPAKIVSVSLPQRAAVLPGDKDDPDSLAIFSVDLNREPSKPQIYLYAWVHPAFSRAGMAAAAGPGEKWGSLVEGTVERGDGTWTEVRKVAGKYVYVFKYVEHGGAVFSACAQCAEALWPRLEPHMRKLVGDFKVTGDAPKIAPPAGYRTVVVDGHDVWTNAKRENYERIVKWQTQVYELMKKVLPGDPVWTGMPRVIVCDDDPTFDAIGAAEYPFATIDSRRRALVVRLTKRRDPAFEQAVQRFAAKQYVRAYFGGPAPIWLEDGLRMYAGYGLLANAHFEQANTTGINKVKAAAAAHHERLDELLHMPKPDAAKREDIDHILWAWHWYLRHGPGAAEHGKTYDLYLAQLHGTGDVKTADDAWTGTDFAKLQTEFAAWVAKWKE